MAISETAKDLNLLLSTFVTKEGGIAILLLLEGDEAKEKMLDWLLDLEKEPTENEALVKALEIHAQMKAEAETQ